MASIENLHLFLGLFPHFIIFPHRKWGNVMAITAEKSRTTPHLAVATEAWQKQKNNENQYKKQISHWISGYK